MTNGDRPLRSRCWLPHPSRDLSRNDGYLCAMLLPKLLTGGAQGWAL